MEQPMMYGEMVQELTRLRAEYEQFIINRERNRIVKLLWSQLQFNYPPDENAWTPKMDKPIYEYVSSLIDLIKDTK